MKMNLFDVFFVLAVQNLEKSSATNEKNRAIIETLLQVIDRTSFSKKIETMYEKMLHNVIFSIDALDDIEEKKIPVNFGEYDARFLFDSPNFNAEFYQKNKSLFSNDAGDIHSDITAEDILEIASQNEYAESLSDSE